MTDCDNLCYLVMPFSLKNVGATCQRMMNKVFWKKTGRVAEVYLDDMIARKEEILHVDDLNEIFTEVQKK